MWSMSRRLKAMRFQHLRRLRNDWLGDENGAGLRHALHPGRDIDRLAEIVLASLSTTARHGPSWMPILRPRSRSSARCTARGGLFLDAPLS